MYESRIYTIFDTIQIKFLNSLITVFSLISGLRYNKPVFVSKSTIWKISLLSSISFCVTKKFFVLICGLAIIDQIIFSTKMFIENHSELFLQKCSYLDLQGSTQQHPKGNVLLSSARISHCYYTIIILNYEKYNGNRRTNPCKS